MLCQHKIGKFFKTINTSSYFGPKKTEKTPRKLKFSKLIYYQEIQLGPHGTTGMTVPEHVLEGIVYVIAHVPILHEITLVVIEAAKIVSIMNGKDVTHMYVNVSIIYVE